jgi:hypothetical protein
LLIRVLLLELLVSFLSRNQTFLVDAVRPTKTIVHGVAREYIGGEERMSIQELNPGLRILG